MNCAGRQGTAQQHITWRQGEFEGLKRHAAPQGSAHLTTCATWRAPSPYTVCILDASTLRLPPATYAQGESASRQVGSTTALVTAAAACAAAPLQLQRKRARFKVHDRSGQTCLRRPAHHGAQAQPDQQVIVFNRCYAHPSGRSQTCLRRPTLYGAQAQPDQHAITRIRCQAHRSGRSQT